MGRKRHVIVDSQGFIVGVLVTEGNTPERLGAAMVALEHQEELDDTEVLWADSGYSGQNFARVIRQICGAEVEIIKRVTKAFEILPKRWVVERTFGWLNRYRRLSKDYETHVENSEAMIYGSLIRLMIRRFAY